MKKLLLGCLMLTTTATFAADPCLKVANKAAKALAGINSSITGTKATLKQAKLTKQTLPSKGAMQSYKVDVKTSDGQEYFYLIQTRHAYEGCFVETVAYWYNE